MVIISEFILRIISDLSFLLRLIHFVILVVTISESRCVTFKLFHLIAPWIVLGWTGSLRLYVGPCLPVFLFCSLLPELMVESFIKFDHGLKNVCSYEANVWIVAVNWLCQAEYCMPNKLGMWKTNPKKDSSQCYKRKTKGLNLFLWRSSTVHCYIGSHLLAPSQTLQPPTQIIQSSRTDTLGWYRLAHDTKVGSKPWTGCFWISSVLRLLHFQIYVHTYCKSRWKMLMYISH